jgi:hypothetical protein
MQFCYTLDGIGLESEPAEGGEHMRTMLRQRSITVGLFVILAILLIAATIWAGLAGCGDGQVQTPDTEEQERAEGETAGEQEPEEEPEGVQYVEGQIKIMLDTDLLWSEGKGDMNPQGEQFKAAVKNLYDLAARHGCTVETYRFMGPFDGAIAAIGLPAGKDEDEAMAEFLEEPLVVSAYRFEASDDI